MDDTLLKRTCDIFDNLNHIREYIPKESKFVCLGNKDSEYCKFFKDCCLEDFMNSTIVTIENINQFQKYNKLPIKYFNMVFISDENASFITIAIRDIRPEVIMIDKSSYQNIFDKLYRISTILTNNYILEINNSQYVLVRRDCYSNH